MSIVSENQIESQLRRTQLELEESRGDIAEIKLGLLNDSGDNTTTTTITPAQTNIILNLLRNGDVNHSVNTWFESAPSASDKDLEAANIYTHLPATDVVLTKKNSKSSADVVNDALKAAAHTNYGANINDPDWDKTNGTIRLGSTNTIDLPFGYYEYVAGDGAGNGTNFVPLHPLFPGRIVYVRVNAARVSAYVKPKGVLYFGIYNNFATDLGYAHGAPFQVSGNTVGTAAATTEAKYFIVVETDQNYSIVSQVLSLPNSPDNSSFNAENFNRLSWTRFAGALRYKIYRKLGTGNVFLLENDSPTTNYIDNNPATRIDTGSIEFPAPENARVGVSAYVATSDGDLDNLPVNGVSDWQAIQASIPFPSTVNLSQFADPALRFGFTLAAAIEIKDGVTDSTANIQSAAAQFVASMIGKNYILRDPLNLSRQKTGTVSAVTSPTEIVLSNAPDWSSSGNILEIADAAPHGILFDLIGASFSPGEWSPHTEDITGRPQIVASNPNGSTQGGIGGAGSGGGSGDDGGVIIRCFHISCIVPVVINNKITGIEAKNLLPGTKCFYGKRDSTGNPKFNVVKRVNFHWTNEILRLGMDYTNLPITPTHRFCPSVETFKRGIAASHFREGDFLLKANGEDYSPAKILTKKILNGKFLVCSVEMEDDGTDTTHLLIINETLSHNRKGSEEIFGEEIQF